MNHPSNPSHFIYILFVALTLLGTAQRGSADVVNLYDNISGTGFVNEAFTSDWDPYTGALTQIAADEFLATGSGLVSEVRFSGRYSGSGIPVASDSFTITFYGDSDFLPGSELSSFNVGNAVGRIDTGIDIDGLDLYSYTAAVTFAITAGTTYWVGIANDTAADPAVWDWGSRFTFGRVAQSADGGSSWSEAFLKDTEFSLWGTAIPEPGSISFGLAGSLFCLGLRRRKRAAKGIGWKAEASEWLAR